MGRKSAVHDANADLVRELRVPADADDNAIQDALMKLFNAQVRDQTESVAVENQAIKAKSLDSDQVLKASDSISDQFSSVQSDSESKTLRSVQFKFDVSISKSRHDKKECTLAIGRRNINIDNSLREKINSLFQQKILYKEILEEMESTRKKEIVRGKEKYKLQKDLLMIHVIGQPDDVQYWRVVVPNDLDVKSLLVPELHVVPYLAHPGVLRTVGKVCRHFWGKGMAGDIREFVESSLTFQIGENRSHIRGGQTFPKNMDFTDSVRVRP